MQTNKKSHFGLILILLAIAMLQFWVLPLNAKIKVQKETLAEKDSEIAKIVGENNIVAKEIVLTEIDKNLLKELIPQGFDQDKLIKIINDIATKNLTQINSISFNKAIVDQNNEIQAIQLSLSGSTNKNNFDAFTRSLESSNRGFIIKNISVNYNEIEALTQASFSLNIEAYFS